MKALAKIGPARLLLAGGLAAALAAAACAHTPQPVTAAEPASVEPEGAAAAEAPADPGNPAGGEAAAQADPSPASPPGETASPSPAAYPEGAPPGEPGTSAEAAEAEATAERRRATLIVIDPGGEDESEKDIVAAARAERERRANAPPASRSITNKNLVKAEGGKTQAKAPSKPVGPAAEKAPGATAPPGAAAAEEYWRTRSYELRLRWKEAVDEIEDLERDADGLRRRFYAESDPYVRDTRVKPDWDRVLDRIREMRDLAERRRQELLDHLEEGRQAGALPGWLREGIELEPAPRGEEKPRGAVEAVEPPEYPEPIGEPPSPPPLGPSR